jgi:hypothetical protein
LVYHATYNKKLTNDHLLKMSSYMLFFTRIHGQRYIQSDK